MRRAINSKEQAAPGTCVPLTEGAHPRVWAVRGKRAWYRVDVDRKVCSCLYDPEGLLPEGRPILCPHLLALTAYLMTAETVRLQFAARRDDAPLPSQDELKEIFR